MRLHQLWGEVTSAAISDFKHWDAEAARRYIRARATSWRLVVGNHLLAQKDRRRDSMLQAQASMVKGGIAQRY